jgi:acetone carboxylase, alpha subunit
MVQTAMTQQKKTISHGGIRLKDMLASNERSFKQTGHYYGLKDLPINEENPMKLEVLASRILATLIAGRETTRMISASPLTREIGELAVALYTPDGDCICQSTGIIIHTSAMGEVIKWMINKDYEDDPAIEEGDCFTSNDNYIAGLHPSDVYDMVPIFNKELLVGWVSTVIMMPEQGAATPGMAPSYTTERFVEGLRFTAEKTGAKGKFFKSFLTRIRLGTRHSDLWVLDRKGAYAADMKVAQDLNKVIDEFGADYYMSAIRELIELDRRAQLERVKRRTIPGKFHGIMVHQAYMSRTLAPPHQRKDKFTLVPWDFHIKPEGNYFMDFDGAGSWGWHHSNTSPSALYGGMCLLTTSTIAYTGRANQGTFLAIGMNTPYDTFVNPSSPFVASGWFFSWALQGGGCWLVQQSRAFFSRGFLEEFRGGTVIGMSVVGCMAGKNHYGQDFGGVSAEGSGAHAGGGMPIRDGVMSDTLFLPDINMGNVEIWELGIPVMWLGRRQMVDSCGWGKYRTGIPNVSTMMVYKTPELAVDIIMSGNASTVLVNTGAMGGYPAANSHFRIITGGNMLELIREQKPLPCGVGYPRKDDIKACLKPGYKETFERHSGIFLDDVMKHGDIIQNAHTNQGGGFGDPIKRDPTLVLKDLENGVVTPESVRAIHCIEAKFNEKTQSWAIDEEGTRKLREVRKKERLAKGIPAKEWYKKSRRKILDGKMPKLIIDMYNDSLNKGQRWPGEYKAFWNLPEDFTMKGA